MLACFLDSTACNPHVVGCNAQGRMIATPADNTADAVCGALKQCTCSHGTGAVGNACPVAGAEKCASCSGPFFLNYVRF